MKIRIIKFLLGIERFIQRRRLKLRGWTLHDGGKSWRLSSKNIMGGFKFALQHDNHTLVIEGIDTAPEAWSTPEDTTTQGAKETARIIDYCFGPK